MLRAIRLRRVWAILIGMTAVAVTAHHDPRPHLVIQPESQTATENPDLAAISEISALYVLLITAAGCPMAGVDPCGRCDAD